MPGVVGACVFWCASLRPSLLPRDWYMQAAISGISAAAGYGLGAFVGWVVGAVRRHPVDPTARTQRIVVGVVVAIGALALIPWRTWQSDQRVLVDEAQESATAILPMLAVALLVFGVFLVIGRTVGRGLVLLESRLRRLMPGWVAVAVTATVFAGAVYVVSTDVVFRRFIDWANERYSVFDRSTPEGVVRPLSATVTGGAGSSVAWNTLGEEGRSFVAGATSPDELRSFLGADADVSEPIRVYAGLRSAGSAEARADLVVRELDRTGASEREMVIVWTSTGTGWVDPVAATAVEYLFAGNTAIASMQYSYLPSWISFLVDGPKAADAGVALNDAVHDWWSGLPAESRPALIVFGESLGSMGTEAAFVGDGADDSVDALTSRSDGVLLVGPTAANEIWRQIEDARAPASPVWAPVFDEGRVVRFAPSAGDVRPDRAAWQAPRVLYVHHPSDPVGSWTMETLWAPPPWIDSPTGDDVPDTVGWFPFVTWLQVAADLAAGFGSEPGHGHNYNSDFVDAWMSVYPADGWSDDDLERLGDLLGSEAETSS